MKTDLILREFRRDDKEALEAVIQEAWHYNEFCGPKTARRLSRVYLSSCLTNQTFTQVAVVQGHPVGVILAKDIRNHTCPLNYRMQQLCAISALFSSAEGRKVSKIFANVNDIDKKLLKESSRKYEGEIAFFAVSASARGRGIGKRLFESALEYMKLQNIHDFYLYTDATCNFGFYEHQGMERRCEEMDSFVVEGQKVDMAFYLYDYHI